MLPVALIALCVWVPFVLLIFALMQPRRAVVFAYVGGWLFLPELAIDLPQIPDLTKITAASLGVALGALLFDSKTLLKFRPKLVDLPMFIWCCSPFVTSLVNDLGIKDAGSNLIDQFGIWGIPYLIGRVYLTDAEGFKELGVGIVIGALLYLPLCYLEMRSSPMLHRQIYGFMQHSIFQTKRPIPLLGAVLGDFRPMVFMQSSLALAMYMTTAALVAFWMWSTKTVRKIANIPMSVIVPTLLATSVLCRTMAAMTFMFVGIAALLWIRSFRKSGGLVAGIPLLCLAAVPPIYMIVRTSNVITSQQMIDFAASISSEDRTQSLGVRVNAEDKITERAFEAPEPLWGWGKWDQTSDPTLVPWRVYREYETVGVDGMPRTVRRDVAATDGLWIVMLGQFGLMGVIGVTASIILPPLSLWRRIPLRYWNHPAVAPAAALAVLLLLHMIDNMLNGMINAIYMLALGGVAALGPNVRKIAARYGPQAAEAALTQQQGGPSMVGYPAMQPPGGYAAAGYPPGYPPGYVPGFAPAAYAYPAAQPMSVQPAGSQPIIPGFPAIAGLQPGRRSPRRGPRR